MFTQRYKSLLAHYGVEGRRIQAAKPNENGDIEQRHYRLKESVDQALMLRGSRDFESREDYEKFLERLFDELNSGRRVRLQEELKRLRRLPERRLESYKRVSVVVKRNNSTIRVDNNTYSVDSRLIGEDVEVRVHAEELSNDGTFAPSSHPSRTSPPPTTAFAPGSTASSASSPDSLLSIQSPFTLGVWTIFRPPENREFYLSPGGNFNCR